ncbi:MAG: acylphosphatase [Defluviimonas sp.]|uniref:acylphosphatase n=1 Tax=Albidovulum sp. TaxID=1872424 RepID=UPI001D2A1F3D|nr:acylphosphatase [Paracoccaceae bacterium]MCC0065281.1 acylphosphatase [Defluviimonas sp.]
MKEIACHIRVTGRVQGVAYRAWAAAASAELGLRGWVRNRGDGSVEALVAGKEDAVKALVLAMGEGPGAARVTDVWTAPADPAEVAPGFEIRPTRGAEQA